MPFNPPLESNSINPDQSICLQSIRQLESLEQINGNIDLERQRRKALEELVRHRRGPVEGLPWLEARLNPPPLDFPPCFTLPLPKENAPTHWNDSTANEALVAWAPPVEYWQHPPSKRYLQSTHLDELVCYHLQTSGTALIEQLATIYPEYQQALNAVSPEQRANILATWAVDTAVDGVDFLRNFHQGRRLKQVFHTQGQSHCSSTGVKPENSVWFPTPTTLLVAQNQNNNDLSVLLMDLARTELDPQFYVPNGEARTLALIEQVQDVIDTCRWHLDHHNSDTEDHRKQLIQTLEEAYDSYNIILQVGQINDEKPNSGYKTFHDLAALIAGKKIDHASDGRYGDTVSIIGVADYLDAFMVTANMKDSAGFIANYLSQMTSLNYRPDSSVRSLFGNLNSAQPYSKQQLTIMSILYLRMPRWQQQTYADLIEAQFNRVAHEHPDNQSVTEKLIFIPSQATPYRLKYSNSYPFDYEQQSENQIAHYLHPLLVLYQNGAEAQLHKPWSRMDVGSEFTDWKLTYHASKFLGYGSTEAWIDSFGNIHPGFEPKNLFQENTQTSETPPTSPAEVIKNPFQFIVESRLGKEVAQKIHELLKGNPETGSLNAVASFSARLERLLGRQPNPDETDFISLLQELGMVNNQTFNLENLDTQQTLDLLDSIREGRADLSDLDDGSVIILLLSTSGVIPRELLVELVLKTYQNLGEVLTLEAALALEKINEKYLFSIFGIGIGKRESRILSYRDRFRQYFSDNSSKPDFDHLSDPQFQKLAQETIAFVTDLMFQHKSYDATMKSSLIAVLAAKEQERFVARCAVDGQLLTAILKLVCPQLQTYLATTYGPEEIMPLADWYDWLAQSDGSGVNSHSFNQTNWKNDNGEMSITAADATGNIVYSIPPSHFSIHEPLNHALTYGQVTYQQFPQIERVVTGHCLTGGSALMAELANDANQLDYALLADPDEDSTLLRLVSDAERDPQTRLEHLNKLLTIAPQSLAFSLSYDYRSGIAAARLKEIVNLCLKTNHLGGSLVAANILRRAAYFSHEINTEAEAIYHLILKQFSSLTENQYRQLIQEHQSLLTATDLESLHTKREAYLDELNQAIADSPDPQTAQTSYQQQVLADNQAQIDERSQALSQGIAQLIQANQTALEASQQECPTLGYQATQQYGHEIGERQQDLVNETRGSLPEEKGFDPKRFESVNPETQIKALKVALTGPDGQLLQGEAAAQRLSLIQSLFIGYAQELGARDTSNPNDTIALAERFNYGLQAPAQALGFTLPPFDPRQPSSLPSVTPRQLLSPNPTDH